MVERQYRTSRRLVKVSGGGYIAALSYQPGSSRRESYAHTAATSPTYPRGDSSRAAQSGLHRQCDARYAAVASSPSPLAAEAGQPKRGGILRVRGWDPPHFDPHL